MSYRLITKASFSLSGAASREVDIRAFKSPKGASVGNLTLNGGGDVPFKLTGGQGRGTVVRCYCYFFHKGESAYIEVSRDEFAALKSGAQASVDTITMVTPTTPTETAPEPVSEAPKAKRTKKVAA